MAFPTEPTYACDLVVGEVIHHRGERFKLVGELPRKPMDDPFAVAFSTQHLGTVDAAAPPIAGSSWGSPFIFRGDQNTKVEREKAAEVATVVHETQLWAWCVLAGILQLATDSGYVLDYVHPSHGDGAGAVAHIGEGLSQGAGFFTHEVDLTVLLTRSSGAWTFSTLDPDGHVASIELGTGMAWEFFGRMIEAIHKATRGAGLYAMLQELGGEGLFSRAINAGFVVGTELLPDSACKEGDIGAMATVTRGETVLMLVLCTTIAPDQGEAVRVILSEDGPTSMLPLDAACNRLGEFETEVDGINPGDEDLTAFVTSIFERVDWS